MDNVIEVKVKSTADVSGFDKAKGATKELGETQEKYVEGADKAEQRTLGLKDAIDGTAVVMQGPGKAGTLAYLQGWADIGSGFSNFIIPVMGNVVKAVKAMTLENLKAAATTSASWIRSAAVATASGARMALAWTLSLGPIALVIGALALVGGALAILWAKSETFRNIVKGAFDGVKDAAEHVWHAIQDVWGWFGKLVSFASKIVGAIEAIGRAFGKIISPIQSAVGWIERFIEDTFRLNGAKFDFSQRSLGTTGRAGGSPGNVSRPGFAHGGITPGGTIEVGEYGRETLTLPAGLRVRSSADTASAGTGGGPVEVVVRLEGGDGPLLRALRDSLRIDVRQRAGGNAQRYWGFA